MASTLRFLIPGILAISGTANLGIRMLPPEYVANRSWEAVTLFVTKEGPFAPRKHYVNNSATGDLSTMANLPKFRRPHFETFTTGPQGFRTFNSEADPAPEAMVFGDSFGGGASLADDDYLCKRLEPLFGGPVFFAGYYSSEAPTKIKHLPKARNVLLQLSERYDYDAPLPWEDDLPSAGNREKFKRLSASFLHNPDYWLDLNAYSPLAIWAGRAYRRLQDDAIFPNADAGKATKFRLIDNTDILILPNEVSRFYQRAHVNLQRVLATERLFEAEGVHPIVVLVPNKFTVYFPLINNLPSRPPEELLYINQIERKLRESGVPVINLTSALRSAAAQELRRNRLVYRVDDTHWNPAGVEAAIEQLRTGLPAAGASFAPTRLQ